MERKHDEKKVRGQKPQLDEPKNQQKKKESVLLNLQHKAGNQAVQRLIAQRKSEEGFDLDDKTTAKIQQSRSGGQALESSLQRQMETKFGKSLDDVKLHTDQPANTLSQQLGASAFTIGSDVFFREGKYDPGSTKGQELLAHELTHVIQQREGKVNSGKPGLNVRPAGDEFEQEADSTAQSLASEASPQTAVAPSVQRQEDWEDEIEATSNYAGIGQALSAPTAAPSQPSNQVEAEQEAATQAPPSSHSQQETAQIEDRPAETKPQQTQQVEAAQEAATQAPPSSHSQQETAQIEDRPAETKPQQVSPTTQTAEQESHQDEAQSNANPSIKPVQSKVRVSAASQEVNPAPAESHSQQEIAQTEAHSKSAPIGQSQAAPVVSSTQQIETGNPDGVRIPSESRSQQETAQVEDHAEAPKEKTIKKNLKKRLKDLNNEQNAVPVKKKPLEEEIMLQPIEEEEEELQMQEEEEEEEEAIQAQMEEEEEEEELQMQPYPEEEEETEPEEEEEEKKPEEDEEPYESYPTQDASTLQTDEQLRREIELHRRSYY
ncbi:MAG: DUF4157 domain-containing protein [Anaerolineaceae bacterium]|nr:DUF4157 domain-containing protein [Anaerolineaceae bacterium]